jgi:hypothetical protein
MCPALVDSNFNIFPCSYLRIDPDLKLHRCPKHFQRERETYGFPIPLCHLPMLRDFSQNSRVESANTYRMLNPSFLWDLFNLTAKFLSEPP